MFHVSPVAQLLFTLPSFQPITQEYVVTPICWREREGNRQDPQPFRCGSPDVRSNRELLPVRRLSLLVLSRTMGFYPGVSVVNSTAGGHAALMADTLCGVGTKLIFYMDPGEILSRTFTSKDTHGTNGDLLVPFTEPERVGAGNQQRVRATTAVLGFGSPSFTYGTDLMLPVEVNGQLRSLLLSGHRPSTPSIQTDEAEVALGIIASFEGVFVPEVMWRVFVDDRFVFFSAMQDT